MMTNAYILALILPLFTPDYNGAGDPEWNIVNQIDHATQTIYGQTYSFTSLHIESALIDAHKRGVAVVIVADRSTTNNKSMLAKCSAAGISCWLDCQHAIAHNKVIIIDGRIVIEGSFNFTEAAEHRNAENENIIISAQLARLYTANWQKHRSHSLKYGAKQ